MTQADQDERTGRPRDDDATSRTGFLISLGAPAAGLAMGVTVVSTYLPVLLVQSTNALVVGALVGGEGFFGIFMPALVGGFSDRTAHRVRDRLRLMLVCAAVVAGALAGLGVVAEVASDTVAWYVVTLVVLYAGYYACLAPYWALYPDLVPSDHSGRSRSAESTWRVAGVGVALVAGGFLLDVTPSLPFLAAALAVVLTCGVLALGLRPHLGATVSNGDDGGRGLSREVVHLLRDPSIRWLCAAQGLWNFALSGLRAFVVLFFVVGMDRSSTFVSTVVFPLVAVGIAIAAPTSGWAADRFGHHRLLMVATAIYTVGMVLPGFWRASWVLGAIPLVALGAATVMTLPFSVLMRLLPEDSHGAASGLFGLCRGLGATLGPIVTGAAVLLTRPWLEDTQGYAALWFCCSAALLLSLPCLWRLRGDERLG